jgi:RNA polymerase sigma-70 factor (ECF subfamily)
MTFNSDPCQSLSDQELIDRSLHELSYFSCLYTRYEKPLRAYIIRLSGLDPELANDILQESFIKIWQNLNGFDRGLKFSTWAYRIVHNETVSNARKMKSFGKDKTVDADLYRNVLYHDDEDHLMNEENVGQIPAILGKMPDKYREILVLKYLEMMSYEEISDILQLPEGTVAIRINRAKKLYRSLASQNDDHDNT